MNINKWGLPIARPKIRAYIYCAAGVTERPLKIVDTPPKVIDMLLSKFASTLSSELKKPHKTRATVFEIPMADTRKVAVPGSMPASFARLFKYKNGTKKPIIQRKPLTANIMNDGDLNKLISNIVASVRRTASGHMLHF